LVAVADLCAEIARPVVLCRNLIDRAAPRLKGHAERHLQRDLEPISLLLVLDLLEKLESA
jgi:hypothetical protein